MLFSVAQPLILWTDVFVLGFLVPAGDVGLYEAAYQVAILPTFSLVAVSAIFPAVVAGYYENDEDGELDQTFRTVTKWVCVTAGFAGGFLVIFANPVLALFGKGFTVVEGTFFVLLASQILSVATGPVNYVLSMTEYERLEMMNTLAVAIFNLITNVILIREFGILGAAVATSLAVVLLDVLRLTEVRYLLGFWPYDWSFLPIFPILGGGIGLMWAITYWSVDPYVQLVTGGVVGSVAVGICAYTLLYTESDRMLFESLG
jgi:O-antigen/teichoic acid export membrane protein